MPITKLKQFKRSPAPPKKRVVVQARDMEIFKNLADYRFLDARQIELLHPGRGGPRYNQRRLQYLFHHGYIDRPPSQLSYYRTRGHLIYALGRKGADAIYSGEPELRGRIDWQKKNAEVKFPFLDHAMMISDFRAALTLALKDHPRAKISSWRQGEDLRDRVRLKDGKVAIVPDAFFTLEEGDDLMHFFLEADRSTMTLDRFLRKLQAYWQWWREGGHEKKFDIKSFRVLTITISPERKENLRNISRQADGRGQGSNLFLFSCEKNYSLEKPEAILLPIWQSSKDESLRHLLE